MKTIVITFSFIFLTCTLTAQQLYQKSYDKTFGDYAESIISDGVNNFVFGYSDSSGTGDNDFVFIKTDSIGNVIFSKKYGGINSDVLYSAIQTVDGGFAMIGNTQSFGAGMTDILLIKIDSLGNYLWSKTYGNIYQDFGYDIKQTLDSGFIIAGEEQSPNVDALLIKTNSSGDTTWTKRYGGSLKDNAQSVEVTFDNKYVFTGLTRSFGAGNEDIYIVKVDSNGILLWTKTIGTAARDEGHSIKEAADKNLILTGRTEGFGLGLGFADCFLINIDSLGLLNWDKVYGNDSIADWGEKVSPTDNGFIITGITGSSYLGAWDALALRTNNIGDTLWTKKYGGDYNEFGSDIIESDQGNFKLVGFENSFPTSSAGMYNIQMDSLGNSACNSSTVGFQVINPAFILGFGGNIQSGLPISISNPAVSFSNTNFVDSLICQITTGIMITPTEKNIFNVFPNPINNNQLLTIDNNDLDINAINIFSELGILENTNKLCSTKTISLPTENLNNGLHILEIVTKSKTFYKKIIVQK